MQTNRLPVLILTMSILYIFIIPHEPLTFKLFFKLIPMVLIIIYAFYQTPKQKTAVHWLILIGLFFCSIGDGTIPWFIVGLSAFLIGHLFYLTGFISRWKCSKWRLASIIPIGIYAWLVGNELVQAIAHSEDTYLVIPVIVYITAIGSMAWFAIMTGNVFASIGSILFVISDSILAWNMFVSPVNYEHVFVMVTYYAAQFLIAHSLSSLGGKHTQIVW